MMVSAGCDKTAERKGTCNYSGEKDRVHTMNDVPEDGEGPRVFQALAEMSYTHQAVPVFPSI